MDSFNDGMNNAIKTSEMLRGTIRDAWTMAMAIQAKREAQQAGQWERAEPGLEDGDIIDVEAVQVEPLMLPRQTDD